MNNAVLDISAKLNASLAERPVPAVGVHPNVPIAEYHRWNAIGSTGLKHFKRSPAHYQAYLAEGSEDTPAMQMGRPFHAAVLEPDTFASRWCSAPDVDRRTKIGRERWDELEAQYGDGFVLKRDDYGTFWENA